MCKKVPVHLLQTICKFVVVSALMAGLWATRAEAQEPPYFITYSDVAAGDVAQGVAPR
jgi:hypothetical protein